MLRTPEGMAISFTIKRWQVQGMAAVATYGGHASRQADQFIKGEVSVCQTTCRRYLLPLPHLVARIQQIT